MAIPWQPPGNCHPFEGVIIETSVPAGSGVYGLHTQRQQLFVGEAADLRATLLLHWNELGNLFLGRQPTHFAFEVCDADTRAQRVEQLIATHRPTIQALQLLAQAALPSAISARPAVPRAEAGALPAAAQWPRTGETTAEPPAKYFSRSQLLVLAALFIFTTTTTAFLGVVTGQRIGAQRLAAWALALARRPEPPDMAAAAASTPANGNTVSAPRAVTNADAKRFDTTRAAPPAGTRQQPIQIANAPSPDEDAATTVANKPAVARRPAKATLTKDKSPVVPAVAQEASTHGWSVQIASTQEEKAALQLQDKLKNHGYQAFIVLADVNSARWYRVRVGRFGAKQEAEATRQVLQSKENIRSAFVIGN